MKTIIFVLITALISVPALSGSIADTNVPAAVKEKFKNDNPEAKVVKWEVTEKHDYKVDYVSRGHEGIAYYDTEGRFIEGCKTIEWKDVPLTGRMEIYHMGKNHIMNIQKITKSKGLVSYKVYLKRGLKRYEVLLDQEGNIVR